MHYLCQNENGDKKTEPTEATFPKFKSPGRDIDNLTTFKNRTDCYEYLQRFYKMSYLLSCYHLFTISQGGGGIC